LTELAVEYVDIGSVTLDPANVRAHSPKNLEAIKGSLRRFGQQKPIVVSAAGTVAAGNGTLTAARELGWTTVAIIRTNLGGVELAAYGIADNRSGELAEWDLEALGQTLAGLQVDGVDLEEIGFTDADLAEMIGDAWGNGSAEDRDLGMVDEVPPVLEVAISNQGDVWLCGPHRVVCGDAVEMLDVAIAGRKVGCVLTDPPYGIDLDTDWTDVGGSNKAILQGVPGGKYRKVQGDADPYDARPLRGRFAAVKEQFWFGGDYYRRTLSDDDLDGSWLVWDKRTEDVDAVFGAGFELIWSAQSHKRDLLRIYWTGVFGDPEARNRVHPTQKPTRLLTTILDRWAPASCVVADPYGGSGSTMIAAHQTGRVACLVEIDPLYVDVICRRWQTVTGDKPILEATGEPHDFVSEAT
jgi:DNA modification methylase